MKNVDLRVMIKTEEEEEKQEYKYLEIENMLTLQVQRGSLVFLRRVSSCNKQIYTLQFKKKQIDIQRKCRNLMLREQMGRALAIMTWYST